MQLFISEEDKKGREGYLLKFDSLKDCHIFVTKSYPLPSPSTLINRTHEENSNVTNSIEKPSTKTTINSAIAVQSQACIAEFNKLIIYCQGIKLKEYNINKAQDLLGKLFFHHLKNTSSLFFPFRKSPII
jgi:hypothetical protein